MKADNFKLILVTNKSQSDLQKYLDFIAVCAKSGLTAVQLREKNLNANDLIAFGKRLKTLLHPFNIPLIVNDDLALCLELNADGLHLGQTDGSVITARKYLGHEKTIGLTVNTLAQVELANNLPIDYIGVGAVFPSNNKPDAQTIWGCDSLKQAASIASHPIVAIGGINTSNAALVMKTKVTGIAAIDAFHQSKNPALTTRTLRQIVNGDRQHD